VDYAVLILTQTVCRQHGRLRPLRLNWHKLRRTINVIEVNHWEKGANKTAKLMYNVRMITWRKAMAAQATRTARSTTNGLIVN